MDSAERSDVIKVADRFYILATSSMADDRTRVLKHEDTFAVFDRYGDVQPIGLGEQGIYQGGTRHLSRLVLRLGGDRPLLLSSTVLGDNSLLAVDLANLDLSDDRGLRVPRGTVHVFRSKFLSGATCFERLRIANFGDERVSLPVSLLYEADFADIFEVRGAQRAQRGRALAPRVSEQEVVLAYEGLDAVVRSTTIWCSRPPERIDGTQMDLLIQIPPGGSKTIFLTMQCNESDDDRRYEDAYGDVVRVARRSEEAYCRIDTANEQFNEWVERSVSDLRMMVSHLTEGPYPYAGVPWFSTPFGRDGVLTALESLWVNPDLAQGVLGYLAATQADRHDPESDAESGKILHETRSGEMAALGEIPFGRYYGSVDSTPLFVMLAGRYYRATADRETVRSIWPNIERALAWIDLHGDLDGDGFVEYQRQDPRGLVNQGWKDSHDSIFHADGAQATGPIALAEVQGYVYAARREAAMLARVLGHPERAAPLEQAADRLRARFEEAFWCPEIGSYAVALDGDKRQCKVRTSNAGHCLFTGIASQEHADAVAKSLLDEAFFSGWGIRTVAATEARYNPMSYHNGSVWPHDNALIAAGLARYGHRDLAMRVLTGLFDASVFVDLHRLPELLCGFPRRAHEGPTLYPVACAPQSWAAAAVFMLLEAVLGLQIDAPARAVVFERTVLPPFLQGLRLTGLRIGSSSVDLDLQRTQTGVTINVLRRDGNVDVIAVK